MCIYNKPSSWCQAVQRPATINRFWDRKRLRKDLKLCLRQPVTKPHVLDSAGYGVILNVLLLHNGGTAVAILGVKSKLQWEPCDNYGAVYLQEYQRFISNFQVGFSVALRQNNSCHVGHRLAVFHHNYCTIQNNRSVFKRVVLLCPKIHSYFTTI